MKKILSYRLNVKVESENSNLQTKILHTICIACKVSAWLAELVAVFTVIVLSTTCTANTTFISFT